MRSMHLACLRAVRSVDVAESESCVTQGRLPLCSLLTYPSSGRTGQLLSVDEKELLQILVVMEGYHDSFSHS